MSFEVIEKALTEHADAVKKTRNDLDRVKDSIGEMNAVITAIAQKSSEGHQLSNGSDHSFMKSIVDSPKLAQLANRDIKTASFRAENGSLRMIMKAAVVGDAGGVGDQPYNVQPMRQIGLYEDPRRPLTVLDVLPRMKVTSNAFEYMQLEGYVSAAGYQTQEGAVKPAGEMDTELQTAPIATIAHSFKASKQVIADVPALTQQMESLLRYGVLQKAEVEIVSGATAGKISGLITQATAFVAPVGATPADAIGAAIASLRVSGWNPDLVLLHPNDWYAIQSEREADSGQYIAGSGWAGPATPTVWGLRAVASVAVTEGTALVLDSSQTLILDREDARVELGYVDDDFTRNLVTMLGEVRLGLAVMSPSAVLKLAI